LTVQIKLTDHVPFREIEVETEAKAPDVCFSNFCEITKFPEEDIQLVVYDQFINQLKTHGLHGQFLTNQPSDDPSFTITGFSSF